MTTDTLGIAIIGLGTVGLRYVEQYQLHDGFELIGGFDLSPDACATAVDRFGVTCADSAEALINDDRVAVVYVAVPPLHHRHYVDLVAAAGKALLCEKPLGVTDEDSVAMVEAVRSAGIPAAVNYVFGAAPSAIALGRDLAAHRHDDLSADLRVHFEDWPRAWQAGATWLRDRDQGGWTREVISHYVFLALRLFGSPLRWTYHAARFPADGTSEQWLTAGLLCDDVHVRIVGSSDAAGADEVEFTVRSAERSWRLTNWYEYSTADRGGLWTEALSPDRSSGPAAFAAQLDQVAKLTSGHEHTLATFDEALQVQRAVEAVLESQAADFGLL